MPDLHVAGSTTLGASGGVVELGPGLNGDRGPATWNVTGVIITSDRPGQSPIPRVIIYRNIIGGRIEGTSYDGSFDQGGCDITLGRGESLIAEWSGGQIGDSVTLTLTGTKQ